MLTEQTAVTSDFLYMASLNNTTCTYYLTYRAW